MSCRQRFGDGTFQTRAVWEASGTVYPAVAHPHLLRRLDDAQTVARGVQTAVADFHTLPVSAGKGIVAGGDVAVCDDDTFTAADVYTVPSLFDGQVLEAAVLEFVSQYGIVRGLYKAHALHPDVFRLGEQQGMRAAHALFAERVLDVHAVDGSAAADADIFDALSQYHGACPAGIARKVGVAGPLTRVVARHVVRGLVVSVKFGVGCRHQCGTFLYHQRHMAFQVYGGGDPPSGTYHHRIAFAGFGDGAVDGFRTQDRGTVAGFGLRNGDAAARGCGAEGRGKDEEKEWQDSVCRHGIERGGEVMFEMQGEGESPQSVKAKILI